VVRKYRVLIEDQFMKYLPYFTLLIWITTISAYFFARGILFNPYILFPLFIILSIVLPVCFWNLQLEKRRLFSFAFVMIFAFNCSWLTYNIAVLFMDVSTIESSEYLILDKELSNRRFSVESPKERENISRYIYEKSGIISAFKNERGDLEIFSPSKIDESVMNQNSAIYSDSLASKGFRIYYIQGFSVVLFIHLSMFIGILVFLILFEGPSAKIGRWEVNA
jgi:hypothetical protein